MRIVEAVAVAVGDQRDACGGEFLAAGNRTLEGHEIGIVKYADAHMLGNIPTVNLGALHGAGNFAQDGHADAGSAVGNQQSRIFRSPGVEDLAGNRSVLREQGGFILRTNRNPEGLDIEMGNMQHGLARVAQHQMFADRRMMVVDAVNRVDFQSQLLVAQPDGQRLSVGESGLVGAHQIELSIGSRAHTSVT